MEAISELVIEYWIIEEDRTTHIARHDVTIDEVLAVLTAQSITVSGRDGRYVIIGTNGKQRYLAVIIGPRPEPGTYGLITARPARRAERALYSNTVKGGEHDD